MATPNEITLINYNGSWTMDRELSDPTDPVLAMQGISWFMRSALAWVGVTLVCKEYPNEEDKLVQHIDVDNVVTGGVQGSSEHRVTDWKKREHSDNIFGTVEGQTRFVRGTKDDDGKVRPALEICTKHDDAKIAPFLLGKALADGSESEGFLVDGVGEDYGSGEGLWLQSYVESVDSTWTAEQIWGFETVGGARYHTRRVAVVNNGDFVLARLVYAWVPPQPEREEEGDYDVGV